MVYYIMITRRHFQVKLGGESFSCNQPQWVMDVMIEYILTLPTSRADVANMLRLAAQEEQDRLARIKAMRQRDMA